MHEAGLGEGASEGASLRRYNLRCLLLQSLSVTINHPCCCRTAVLRCCWDIVVTVAGALPSCSAMAANTAKSP